MSAEPIPKSSRTVYALTELASMKRPYVSSPKPSMSNGMNTSDASIVTNWATPFDNVLTMSVRFSLTRRYPFETAL